MNFNSAMIFTGVNILVAAVSVTAIFFPDTFNLEKEVIDRLSIPVETKEDFEKVEDILKKHTNTEDIFYLDLLFCGEHPDGIDTMLFKNDNIFNIKTDPNQSGDDIWTKGIYLYPSYNKGKYKRYYCSINEKGRNFCQDFPEDFEETPTLKDYSIYRYKFISKDSSVGAVGLTNEHEEAFDERCSTKGVYAKLTGYFTFKKIEEYQDWPIDIVFEKIPDVYGRTLKYK